MSEYVIDMSESSYQLGTGLICAEIARLREEIVRCRDCRYYDEIIHACERFDSIKQDNVSYVFDDGFCAWGERRGE